MTSAPRYERKYLVAPPAMADLRRDLDGWLTRDAYVDETGAYGVESTYFDTRDLRLYRDSADGEGERAKVRLRRYTATPGAAWLEVKGRTYGAVSKSRTPIAPSASSPGEFSAQGRALIVNAGLPMALAPVVTVRYRRFAASGRGAPTARVTLDDRICAETPEGARARVLTTGWGVLELKTGRLAPSWWRFIVGKYDLTESSASKYAMALDALGAGRVFAP